MDVMESVAITDTHLPDRTLPGQGGGAIPCLDIELDARVGSLRIYDPRLFQARRRRFCERLLKAASRQPGIVKAEVELASASCQIEFSPGKQTTAVCMADSFVRAVREASGGCALLDRIRWWQRGGAWTAMTAFRLPDNVSLWEAFEVTPAQIRLRRRGLTGNRARLFRLAGALTELEGVEACRVSRWSQQITIDICREGPVSDRILDTVEQATACLKAAELLRSERAVDEPVAAPNRLTRLFRTLSFSSARK
jgi:hypothetical protein